MSEPTYTGRDTDFYVASAEMADVVNLAAKLRRPLLVEGEPGCGKTQLAYSIAAEKKLGDVLKISVKSTSRAQDLLYRFNALRRLQEAQDRENKQARLVHPYLSLGPLGNVIYKRERRVVLIDEIDKADIDFPNDLLEVLDTFEFQIDDLPPEEEAECLAAKGFGRTVKGDRLAPPIVVITSNREKRLPEPFLRRCLYLRVRFPETVEALREIVRRNAHGSLSDLADDVLNALIAAFLRVRGLAVGATQKPPTTSELIDWVQIVHWKGVTPESLASEPHRPPQWTALFKTMADLDTYDALSRAASAQRKP
jgi:MoxR-like ATPase